MPYFSGILRYLGKEYKMATLTIELPEILVQQVQTRGISQQGLQQLFVRIVQLYLHESDATLDKVSPTTSLAHETFARQVTANHRELFEKLVPSARYQPETASSESSAPTVYRYPTVPVPASALDNLIGLLPGVEGDALADTEGVYDNV
jgi:hypothetical protein